MWLPSSKNEPQWLEYFKLVILEIQKVTIRSVLLNQVTYIDALRLRSNASPTCVRMYVVSATYIRS